MRKYRDFVARCKGVTGAECKGISDGGWMYKRDGDRLQRVLLRTIKEAGD
jgi:hypothetical protein